MLLSHWVTRGLLLVLHLIVHSSPALDWLSRGLLFPCARPPITCALLCSVGCRLLVGSRVACWLCMRMCASARMCVPRSFGFRRWLVIGLILGCLSAPRASVRGLCWVLIGRYIARAPAVGLRVLLRAHPAVGGACLFFFAPALRRRARSSSSARGRSWVGRCRSHSRALAREGVVACWVYASARERSRRRGTDGTSASLLRRRSPGVRDVRPAPLAVAPVAFVAAPPDEPTGAPGHVGSGVGSAPVGSVGDAAGPSRRGTGDARVALDVRADLARTMCEGKTAACADSVGGSPGARAGVPPAAPCSFAPVSSAVPVGAPGLVATGDGSVPAEGIPGAPVPRLRCGSPGVRDARSAPSVVAPVACVASPPDRPTGTPGRVGSGVGLAPAGGI
eukprot:IDg5633t1